MAFHWLYWGHVTILAGDVHLWLNQEGSVGASMSLQAQGLFGEERAASVCSRVARC